MSAPPTVPRYVLRVRAALVGLSILVFGLAVQPNAAFSATYVTIGLRFFLVALPFPLVLCGRLLETGRGVGRRQRWAVGGLVVALAASVLSQFPHYLSYFNELVYDRKMAYKILADSNLEWGQDRGYMKEFLRRHPQHILHPREPTSGRLVVSVNRYVGVVREPLYEWLRNHFEPVDRIAGSYLIFDVTPEALERALAEERRTSPATKPQAHGDAEKPPTPPR